MGKDILQSTERVKKYPAHQVSRKKKFPVDQKSTTHPTQLPPKLNGPPLRWTSGSGDNNENLLDLMLCFGSVYVRSICFYSRRLVEKLENMRNNALGDGKETCLLCGSKFGTLKVISKRCDICDKVYYTYRRHKKLALNVFVTNQKWDKYGRLSLIQKSKVNKSFDLTFDGEFGMCQSYNRFDMNLIFESSQSHII